MIRRMRIACCVSKPTDTHSEYVILIVFSLQQWLHVHCPSFYHISGIFVCLHPLMDLIRINSRTALVKGENDRVLQSYTVTSLLSVRSIDYYMNKNWPRHSHTPNSTTAVHTCAAIHTRLHHGADSEPNFLLTITWNFIFCSYKSNQHMHTILLKSQYYKHTGCCMFTGPSTGNIQLYQHLS
jgi:hypothetical protein